MQEIHGNTEGIRQSVLDNLKTLYDYPLDGDSFCPQEVIRAICAYSAAFRREIGLYITRYGEIADIIIGKSASIDLPDLRLRRGTRRLSMVRCIHTHPGGSGNLSDVDLSALKDTRFDAMCAVGVKPDGTPTSTQCAFLDPDTLDGLILTEVLPAHKLPQKQWMDQIDEIDATYIAKEPDVAKEPERAVLVGIESDESLDELEALVDTAGGLTVLKVLQKRLKPDTAYCIGKGKAEELSLTCQAAEADIVIFDEELSGAMQKNLEEVLHLKVIDRTTVILDIFARRARSREGKLQVEMAQLKYRSQRLLGAGVVMSRLAGGIGTRGPGESKLEMNRRRIRERMNDLQKELDQIEKQRGLRRSRREKNNVPIIALVGYTNAGKSTLFNNLTRCDVLAEDKLFATLDSTSRPLELPDGTKTIAVDTVGFIRKLPHELVQAFRSTLEEARLADVLLLINDGSSPSAANQLQTVEEVLQSLDATDAPRVLVWNKCDIETDIPVLPGSIPISAKTGKNLDELLQAIAGALAGRTRDIQVKISFEKYNMIGRIRKHAAVMNEEWLDDGVLLSLRVEPSHAEWLREEGFELPEDMIPVNNEDF